MFGGTADAGGLPGGLQTDKDCRILFVEQLRAAGFTAEQIQAIDAAMVGAGVTLATKERVSQ